MKRKILATILLSFCLVCIFVTPVLAALAMTSGSVTDWTAVAAQGTGESSAITLEDADYVTAVNIQAFLDSTTAHEGTDFHIQVSSNSSGDEDWHDFAVFRALVGTANSEAITDDPLASASTTITVADTGGEYETEPMGKWIAIEDGTLANSELIWLTGFTTDTNITCQDGTTNEHAQNTLMYDIAISKTVIIPIGAGSRARVIVNNGVDMDGTASSLNYRIRKTSTTGL